MLTLDHSPAAATLGVLGGMLMFRGIRVPAPTLLDYLQDGFSLEQFLACFPSVQADDARAFLRLVQSRTP